MEPMDLDQLAVAQRVFDEAARMARPLKAVREGRKSLLEHQVHVYKRLDAALAAVVDPPSETLACRRGCNYCCHYHVYVSAPEAFALAAHVRGLPAIEREAVLDRLRRNAAQAAELGLDAHIQTNIACAFLDAQGDCSVYELRPLACRRHHSFDVTPCRVTFEDPSRTDPLRASAERHLHVDVLVQAALQAAVETGVDVFRYELSGAVLEASIDSGCTKRWGEGRVSFETVADREHPMDAREA